MKPKERAEKIYKEFSDATVAYDCGDHSAKGINQSMEIMESETKRCALILVSYLIKENEEFQGMVGQSFNFDYWQEVKAEIEKM